jgi:hypothetical protein
MGSRGWSARVQPTFVLKRMILIVGFAAVLAAGLSFWFFAYDADEMASRGMAMEIVEKIQVGMSVAEVDKVTDQAWHSDECTSGGVKQELFFVGTHDPAKAGVIAVKYADVEGDEKVSEVKWVSDTDLPSYDACSSLDLSNLESHLW